MTLLDLNHQKVVVALKETAQIMNAIDQLIPDFSIEQNLITATIIC